ncbi:MAG: DUF499 domain-containing protein [Planctomycetota bacterium]
MAKLPWTPWHQVVQLRDDLKTGDLPLSMFAADLYEVIMQNGERPVYEEPDQFFALTFPTHNLRNLARDVCLRVAGRNDKAVRQLELTYGGGKTHTLITLFHLMNDPTSLPDLPAVKEFVQAIGETPPAARVAALCFDKLDVEKGMDVKAPDGGTRVLKHPWSVLAYQIAGDDGLKLLHAEDEAEERESAPAENLLNKLLRLPDEQGLSILILMDEVLMYAREKIRHDASWEESLINFFQYLTQAATHVDGCCIVASLLATDPAKLDGAGTRLLDRMRDIFTRQQEEVVQPVEKQDVAEVLRRRFFKPESIKDKDAFRAHVIAAMKGIAEIDDQTKRQEASEEDRYTKSYPFHPDLTEVLYEKWTDLPSFQKTRGVLRTFALALREAVLWDQSPLVGPQVFLNEPGKAELSPSCRELVVAANSQRQDGQGQGTAWGPILEGELGRAMSTQSESVGLNYREIEQAIVATFLHSQPIGQSAQTREFYVLLGTFRTDKIELEKGLGRWAQVSHWLDDRFLSEEDGDLPATWRLGNKPNLNQMHAVAVKNITDDIVRARLIDDIGKTKKLVEGASGSGVRVHMLPTKPKDIEDDGQFHYAVLGPNAACESGKPSGEAKRFLEETTGSEKPRVFRNAVLLLCPSKDGLDLAHARVREFLAWTQVRHELSDQQDEGSVDVARMTTLAMNIDKAKGRIPEAIRQAYSTVVTISEQDEVQAFKLTVTDDGHFTTIKNDPRSRIQDTAITAEALLPDGPYDLWKEGEKDRRVKDLAGAFAQLPHLPKMLKAQAIVETLVDGCVQGTFVLRLMRPDRSFRTWWRSRPDDAAMNDPAMELVLPVAAELAEVSPNLVAQGALPQLWDDDSVSVRDVIDYFSGSTIVQVDRGGFTEPMHIPKAPEKVVKDAIGGAVESGLVWLVSGPASVLAEEIPTGVLTDAAELRVPLSPIPAPEILQENLPDAWEDGRTTAMAIATALSQQKQHTLPWKTVRDAINAALQARFLELSDDSGEWPCDFAHAQAVILAPASGKPVKPGPAPKAGQLVAQADFDPSELQDLGDAVPTLLELKARYDLPLAFHIRLTVGDGEGQPSPEAVQVLNEALADVKHDFRID